MKKMTTIFLVAVCAIASCKKSATPAPSTPKTTSAIVAPTGFNWANSRNVNLTVNISDAQFPGITHVISVYDGDPSVSGKIIMKGGATTSAAYQSKIYFPTQLTDLYIVCTAPNNVSIIQKVTPGTSSAVTISMAN